VKSLYPLTLWAGFVEKNAFSQYLLKKKDIVGIDLNAIDAPPKVMFNGLQCGHEGTVKTGIFKEWGFGDDAYI